MATKTTESTASSSEDGENSTLRWRGPSLNRVSLIGRLTADPELKHTASEIPVAHLRVATNEREDAEFHDIVVWRHLAEIVAKIGVKGQLVYIEGRLHGRTWETEDGQTRRSVEIIADTYQALSAQPRG